METNKTNRDAAEVEISRRILLLVRGGADIYDAIDKVLGDGASARLKDAVYESMRPSHRQTGRHT